MTLSRRFLERRRKRRKTTNSEHISIISWTPNFCQLRIQAAQRTLKTLAFHFHQSKLKMNAKRRQSTDVCHRLTHKITNTSWWSNPKSKWNKMDTRHWIQMVTEFPDLRTSKLIPSWTVPQATSVSLAVETYHEFSLHTMSIMLKKTMDTFANRRKCRWCRSRPARIVMFFSKVQFPWYKYKILRSVSQYFPSLSPLY